LAGAEIVFAPAAVGSRLLANLVEGQEIPQELKTFWKDIPAASKIRFSLLHSLPSFIPLRIYPPLCPK
jgi:hypothetical protein